METLPYITKPTMLTVEETERTRLAEILASNPAVVQPWETTHYEDAGKTITFPKRVSFFSFHGYLKGYLRYLLSPETSSRNKIEIDGDRPLFMSSQHKFIFPLLLSEMEKPPSVSTKSCVDLLNESVLAARSLVRIRKQNGLPYSLSGIKSLQSIIDEERSLSTSGVILTNDTRKPRKVQEKKTTSAGPYAQDGLYIPLGGDWSIYVSRGAVQEQIRMNGFNHASP